MTQKRPTIRDVAAAAGVSVTTVSDSVNGKGRVDPATRQAVLETAKRLGWAPRRAAQALRSGRSGIVALCLPTDTGSLAPFLMQTEYYMSVAAAAATRATDLGLMLLLSPPLTPADATRLQLDGVVVVDPVRGDPSIATANEAGVPYVTIDQELGSDSAWWVSADEGAGIRLLLDHLAGRGATRIVLFSADAPWAWFQNARRSYDDWCGEHGLAPEVQIVDLVDCAATAETAALTLLGGDDPPDAIVGVPNGAAIGVLRAAQQLGLTVPDEVAIASGVDGSTMVIADPSITALDLLPAQAGEAAIDLLLQRIEGGAAGPVVFPPKVHFRASS